MSIRFQADADLNQIIVLATIRREPAIDFETAVAAAADDLLLIWALTEPAEWTNRICFLPLWRHFPAMESPKTAERKSDLTTGSILNVDRDEAQFQCRTTRRPRQGTCDGELTMDFFRHGRASGGNRNRVWLESACLVDRSLPGWEWKAVFVSLEADRAVPGVSCGAACRRDRQGLERPRAGRCDLGARPCRGGVQPPRGLCRRLRPDVRRYERARVPWHRGLRGP